ncbi:hypothetical protein STHU_24750 [Allostella humosa]|uniref:hypothetical protein n=1 Tax=Stella humosa TaxID=94 RepID=UPI00113653A7|nr:hypothetical protein [Stella humosa]BBK31841.1 hypothetical protein STHU_24750 [Stella humosa]
MVLPIIPIALFGIFGSSATGLAIYAMATKKQKDEWNKIISRWLGIPVEEVIRQPARAKKEWSRQVREAAITLFERDINDLTQDEVTRVIEYLSQRQPATIVQPVRPKPPRRRKEA